MQTLAEHTASSCVCCGGTALERSAAVLMPFLAHRIYNWEPACIDESWGLKTIASGHAYSLCNSLLCKQCRLLFLDIRFSDAEMSRLYEDYRGVAYTRLRERYEPGYAERNANFVAGINYMDEVEAFLKPLLPTTLSILDWGGDTGVNTPFKHGNGNTVHIYDISGIESSGQFKNVSLQSARLQSYDLVVCSNVLEHVPYPLQLLQQIQTVMHKDTVLYLEVPLENHVYASPNDEDLLTKKRHWHEHINFFSAPSLHALLARAELTQIDFTVKEIRSEGVIHHQFMVACKCSPATA